MSFRTTLAAVGLAAGLVLAPLASPATSHAAPDVDVVAAADWLSGQFTDNQYLKGFDGSTPDPATTIDGVLALVAADAHPELVASTVTWLGGQAGELASTPTSAARAAILAEAVGQDAANFGGVNLVTAMQGDLGDAASNPYGLALLVIGLERTDTQVPAAVVDALLATQQDDGAFAFPDFGVDIDSTALAAQALSLLDDNERAGLAQRKAVGWLIDNAMEAIERENEKKLKNVLNKDFARTQIDSHKLADLIAHFSDTQFHAKEYNGLPLNLKSKDILGHVYEYFLGQFALAEGKKGGQYYTPKSIVTLIVEMLQPFKGRVYDPAMGSGGFFVQSEEFIDQHGGKVANGKSGQISVYGQESNPTTWRLAAMNMAIRGIDFNFGGQPADTMLNDLHPDLRADYVMANPPFNMKEWWSEKLANDPRWICGTPPQGNANFAWLQHMLHHLAPSGSMALLLANGSMSSNTNNEGEIRKKLIEDDFVECMVALPGQLFTNTQIPACIWFLSRDKANGFNLDKKKRDRRGQFLFIDARSLGYMKDRVLRDFTTEDIRKISDTFHAWQHHAPSPLAGEGRGEGEYCDIPGFCFSATLDDIRKHEHVLTPGRYVGAEEQEDDGEAFSDKMGRLTAQLAEQFDQSHKLEGEIKKNLAGLGYGF